MINNFNLIRGLLRFATSEDFYFVQILRRRKDNPDMARDMIVINYHCIYSYKEFDNYENIIIDECMCNNARAYINLNRRNTHRVAVRTLVKVSQMLENKDYKNVKGAYPSACGEINSEANKRWIIDIDTTDSNILSDIITILTDTGINTVDIHIIPTKAGCHIITPGFDTREFKLNYPGIDIHKDNPTILYIP